MDVETNYPKPTLSPPAGRCRAARPHAVAVTAASAAVVDRKASPRAARGPYRSPTPPPRRSRRNCRSGCERARHADEPVDRQHQHEADRRDRRDRLERRRENDDRRPRHAMRALRGQQRDAEHQQDFAERQRRVGRLRDEYDGERQIDRERVEVERIAGRAPRARRRNPSTPMNSSLRMICGSTASEEAVASTIVNSSRR